MIQDPLIRVLLMEDSAYSGQAIPRMGSVSPPVEVGGSARDGEEALRKSLQLKPVARGAPSDEARAQRLRGETNALRNRANFLRDEVARFVLK